MDEHREADVEQIMERIRENIKKRRQELASNSVTPPSSAAVPPDRQMTADFVTLHSGYDVCRLPFTSHRKLVGPLLIFVRNILVKLLTPILARQVSYNAASTRVVTQLQEQQARLQGEILTARERVGEQQAQLRGEVFAMRERVEALGEQQAQRVQALGEQQAQLRSEVLEQTEAFQVVRERTARAERKLRRILYVLTDGQEGRTEVRVEPRKIPGQALEPDFDYLGFAERIRGSEEEIRERQRIYVEYFNGKNNILDIGCGRGEFLELLTEAGITAKGVDLDLDMVLLCREKGLEVEHKDAFQYLGSLPDESLGGIFAAQLIEHLESDRIIQLVKLCHRKLRPGGVLVLETPNPRCLVVFAENFYKDLSHIRPVHPDAMKFLFEAVGFEDIELRDLVPLDSTMRLPRLAGIGMPQDIRDAFDLGIERLNNLLYGYQEYAVIGKKNH